MGRLTGTISLWDRMWGEGEGVSSPDASLADGVMGLGRDFENEDPRLPGDMNLETMFKEPNFSQR